MSEMGLLVVGNFLSASRGTRFYCEELSDHLQADGCRVVRTSSRCGRFSRLVDMLLTVVVRRREYQIAIVEVYSGLSFLWAEMVSQLLGLLGKPFVLVLHGGGLAEWAENNPRRLSRLFKSAPRVVTPSLFLQSELSGFRGDIGYLPNALRLGDYHYRARSTLEPKLCWIRAFNEMYNPEMVVEVIKQVRDEFPNARLAMIGPTRNTDVVARVKHLIAKYGLEDSVEIVGPVPKAMVPEILNEYDVFLNTTRFESFGIAVMEAALCGLPIVSTRVGEIPFLWIDGKEVLMVPAGDSDQMAKCVCDLLKNPEISERLAKQARLKAAALDWAVILPQWRLELEEILRSTR